MPVNVNVFNVKVNSITNNGSLNVGPVIHNSHSARTKLFGGNSTIGDESPAEAFMKNAVHDADFVDQSDIATSDTAYTGQT
jgi:hypothetical protein